MSTEPTQEVTPTPVCFICGEPIHKAKDGGSTESNRFYHIYCLQEEVRKYGAPGPKQAPQEQTEEDDEPEATTKKSAKNKKHEEE